MRPRVFPAEDPHPRIVGRRPQPASMRPRVFPAEDAVPLVLACLVLPLQ